MAARMSTSVHILKAVRVAFGLTQGEMASLAGVSPRSIARFELGQDSGKNTFRAVKEALENKGVSFLDKTDTEGYGVRMPIDWEGPEPDLPSPKLKLGDPRL